MYNWDDCKAFSKGVLKNTEKATIMSLIPDCVSVEEADLDTDRSGTDWIAKLSGGRTIPIDAKARSQGCSRFWKNAEPELALEFVSVVQTNKIGWTLSTTQTCELVLFTFHPSDTTLVFLLPFQLLRKAFLENGLRWRAVYKNDTQTTDWNGKRWNSRCVFVPVPVVIDAIAKASCGILAMQKKKDHQGDLFAD